MSKQNLLQALAELQAAIAKRESGLTESAPKAVSDPIDTAFETAADIAERLNGSQWDPIRAIFRSTQTDSIFDRLGNLTLGNAPVAGAAKGTVENFNTYENKRALDKALRELIEQIQEIEETAVAVAEGVGEGVFMAAGPGVSFGDAAPGGHHAHEGHPAPVDLRGPRALAEGSTVGEPELDHARRAHRVPSDPLAADGVGAGHDGDEGNNEAGQGPGSGRSSGQATPELPVAPLTGEQQAMREAENNMHAACVNYLNHVNHFWRFGHGDGKVAVGVMMAILHVQASHLPGPKFSPAYIAHAISLLGVESPKNKARAKWLAAPVANLLWLIAAQAQPAFVGADAEGDTGAGVGAGAAAPTAAVPLATAFERLSCELLFKSAAYRAAHPFQINRGKALEAAEVGILLNPASTVADLRYIFEVPEIIVRDDEVEDGESTAGPVSEPPVAGSARTAGVIAGVFMLDKGRRAHFGPLIGGVNFELL